MPRRALAIVIAVAATMTALVVPAAATGKGISASFQRDEVRIRSGPRLNAAVKGLGYRAHQVTVWCLTYGDPVTDDPSWFRLTDRTTGVEGYSYAPYVSINQPVRVPDC